MSRKKKKFRTLGQDWQLLNLPAVVQTMPDKDAVQQLAARYGLTVQIIDGGYQFDCPSEWNQTTEKTFWTEFDNLCHQS